MSNVPFFFAGVFVLTIASAFLGRFVASFFVDDKSMKVAGFAYSIGAISGLSQFNEGGATQMASIVGGVTGLVAVWYLFFKREKAHG